MMASLSPCPFPGSAISINSSKWIFCLVSKQMEKVMTTLRFWSLVAAVLIGTTTLSVAYAKPAAALHPLPGTSPQTDSCSCPKTVGVLGY